jgi:Protein of unknown function (DUF1524)
MRRPSASSQLLTGIVVIAMFAVLLSLAALASRPPAAGTPFALASSAAPSANATLASPNASQASFAVKPVASVAGPAGVGEEPTVQPTLPSTFGPTQPPTQPPTLTPTPTSALGPTPTGGQYTLAQLLALLPTQPENRAGYSRALFVLWIDANGDGCDTRHEVLIEESLTPVTVGARCSLFGGSWLSFYDGLAFTDPSKLDIDHMVPLAEAWDSGASTWSAERREAYANDLGVPWALIAVSASANRSKGDRDPAEWMPPAASAECPYLADWLAVKVRWQLAVDPTERAALNRMIADCPNTTMSVPLAAPGPLPKPSSMPGVTPMPTPTSTLSGNCAASYPDFCIPPPPPDLDCADIGRHNFTVLWNVPDPDPHHFDGDKDGIGCES